MKGKSLFLLAVFLLNTIAGFCCAVNTCNGNPEKTLTNCCTSLCCKKRPCKFIHSFSPAQAAKGQACCRVEVKDFTSLVKLAPQTTKIHLQIPVVFIGTSTKSALDKPTGNQIKLLNFVVNRRRPPKQNIRISIQSFQI